MCTRRYGDVGVYHTDMYATAERATRAMETYGREEREDEVFDTIESLLEGLDEDDWFAETGGILVLKDEDWASVFVRVGTVSL